MSDLYFVQVIAEDGAVSRWEALDKTQADFVYNQQVIIYGAENCTDTNEFCFTCPGWLVVYSAIVSLILIISIVLLQKKQRKRKYSGIEMTRNEKNEI